MPTLYYRTNPNFMPKSSSLFLWLNTRKSGSPTAPGLFKTEYFPFDAVSFVFVLFLELLGLYQLYAIAGIPFLQVLFLFFIDYGLVIIKHFSVQKKLCLCENELVIWRGHPDAEARLKSKKRFYKFWKVFWSIPIVLIAYIKIDGFLSAVGSSGPQGVIIGIVSTYIAVAILHILSSGYFLSEILTTLSFWLDFRAYKNQDPQVTVTKYALSTIDYSQIELKVPCKCAIPEHSIVLKDQITQQIDNTLSICWNKYEINSWSILDDDHLNSEIINAQPTNTQKIYLERYTIKHQVEIILNKSLLDSTVKNGCQKAEDNAAKEALALKAKNNESDLTKKDEVYKKVRNLLGLN